MATLARLNVILGLQSKEFTKALSRAQRSIKRFGTQAERAGRTMSTAITAPLVAAGAAAVKFATDFNTSFRRIEGLVGVASDEVGVFRDEILKLGGEVGKAPVELAEAMFDITSAGFRGESAMKALTAAAQASAAGLGETRIVADALTNAVNAYGESNLSAAQSTAVLVATVREGKASAETLAPVIGQLVPLSAELGISFDQVGAGLAHLTRTTGNAALASTQLRNIMAGILRPTEQARQKFLEFGTSSEEVRKILREDGLLATLLHLRDTFGENTEALGKTFKSIEAVSGILALTRDNGAAAQKIFDSLASTTETDLKEAFDKTAGPARDFGKIVATIQAAAIQLGESILPVIVPVIQSLAEVVTRLADGFAELPTPLQRLIVGFGILAAAAGPILFIVGGIATAIATAGTAWAIWAAAIAGGVALIVANFDQIGKAVRRFVEFARPALSEIGAFIVEQWNKVRDTAIEVWPYVAQLFRDALELMSIFWEAHGEKIVRLIRVAWDTAKRIIATAVDVMTATIKGFVQIVSGDWQGLKDTITDLAQKIQKNAQGYLTAGALKIAAGFRGMAADIAQSIQSVIGRMIDWATVIAEFAFLDPATRKAAEAAIGVLEKAYGGVGSVIVENQNQQKAFNSSADAILQNLITQERKVREQRGAWEQVKEKVSETATTITDEMGTVIDVTTRQLKGGFGAAADEFLMKTNEAKEEIENAPPIHVKIIPVIDAEEYRRQQEELGISPDTAGFTGP